MSVVKIRLWINKSCILERKFKIFLLSRWQTKIFLIFTPIHNFYWFKDEFSLCSCFRCNIQISNIAKFKRNFLGNNKDLEFILKFFLDLDSGENLSLFAIDSSEGSFLFKIQIFRFSLQYTTSIPWIRINEAFLRFETYSNWFFA